MSGDPFYYSCIDSGKQKQPDAGHLPEGNGHDGSSNTVDHAKRAVYQSSVCKFSLLPCGDHRFQYPPKKRVDEEEP